MQRVSQILTFQTLVPLDLNGTPRNDPADAGAYQSTEFPPEGIQKKTDMGKSVSVFL